MPIELDDPATIDACRILANAVHQVRVPGIVEFGLIERSLDMVVREHSQTAFTTADGAFRTLDRDSRKAIAGTAIGMAHATVAERKKAATPASAIIAEEPVAEAVTTTRRLPRRPPSGLPALLTAINHRSAR